MKKTYIKPDIQTIVINQQSSLLAGSKEGMKSLAIPGGEEIVPAPDGLDDEDDDV